MIYNILLQIGVTSVREGWSYCIVRWRRHAAILGNRMTVWRGGWILFPVCDNNANICCILFQLGRIMQIWVGIIMQIGVGFYSELIMQR